MQKRLALSVFVIIFSALSLLFSADYKLLKPQRVEFKANDGLVIVGTYYPVHKANPSGVILLHMLGRNRGDWNDFARYLQKEEISVLSLDLRGHGESTNLRSINWRLFLSPEPFQKMIDDVGLAKNYLIVKGVNKEQIGILGMNLGANLALSAAAQDSSIRSVVLLSPGADYKGLKISAALPNYGNRPIYVICSKKDQYSLDATKEIQSLVKGKIKVDIYNYGTNIHLFNKRVNLYKSVVEWFRAIFQS